MFMTESQWRCSAVLQFYKPLSEQDCSLQHRRCPPGGTANGERAGVTHPGSDSPPAPSRSARGTGQSQDGGVPPGTQFTHQALRVGPNRNASRLSKNRETSPRLHPGDTIPVWSGFNPATVPRGCACSWDTLEDSLNRSPKSGNRHDFILKIKFFTMEGMTEKLCGREFIIFIVKYLRKN